jgi:hypothetical protein
MPFEFGIKDIIDIFLVALILYYIYKLMKASRSLKYLCRHYGLYLDCGCLSVVFWR